MRELLGLFTREYSAISRIYIWIEQARCAALHWRIGTMRQQMPMEGLIVLPYLNYHG